MHRLLMTALGAAFLALPAASPAGADELCDPALLGLSSSPLAYQQRGNRCEGLFDPDVSRTGLQVRSFVAVFEPFAAGEAGDLRVDWVAPPGVGATRLRLRAQTLEPRVHYRMDTRVPAASGSYRWPGTMLAQLRLPSAAIGLVGWLPLADDGSRPAAVAAIDELYLPLRVHHGAPGPFTGYRVAVVPTERLRTLAVTVERLAADGHVEATLRSGELGYGYYPVDLPTEIALEPPPRSGYYRLRMEGRGRRGGIATADVLFFHPAPGEER